MTAQIATTIPPRQRWHCSFSLALMFTVILIMTLVQMADSQVNNVFDKEDANDPILAVDYYNRIRTDPSLVENVVDSNISNVFRVTDKLGNTFRLADISCFLPFSNGTGDLRQDVENDAFAALLATHHFNLDQKGESCNVRLTTELFDTSFNPISSTRIFTDILQRNHSLSTPLPSGVVGAYRSATTSPLAILSGVNNIAQVSYASTSADFEVTEQYPYFGRTCASSSGDAQVSVDLFQYLDIKHVGVLFVTDSFGSAFQKAFQDASTTIGIHTESVAFSFSSTDGTEIKNAVSSLNNTKIRAIFAICFEDQYVPIMTEAHKQGLVGPDYLWIFPGFQKATFHKKAVFEEGSPLIEATKGIGLMEFAGGLVPETIYPNSEQFFDIPDNPVSGFDKFRQAWREALADRELVEYFKSLFPESVKNVTGFDENFEFDPEPGSYGALIYDAIISLGLSMCRATTEEGEPAEFFGGAEVYEVFSNLDFEGASGNVLIQNDTGTRDYRTLTYTIWNVQEHDERDEQGRVQFKLVPTTIYTSKGWQPVEGNPYIYADGSTVPPEELPPVDMNNNLIGSSGQAVGYSLMAIVMFCAVASLIWMVWYRNMAVVRQSQPLFLCMVSLGTLVMATTIIPLSLEEPTQNLDTACMSAPWVYLSGAIVAFSALFAKTRGIYMAYKNPDLDKILVTPMDIFVTFTALFGVNLVIMITWTLVAPLEWDRIISGSTDIFNRPTESHGTCTYDNALPFVIVVLVLNMGILVIANFQAYQSRNIETEYNESRYIGISMAAFLQAWCMGIPILIVVWDKPQAKFFVQSGIIFVTALAVLLLIYVPKMRAIRKEYKRALQDSKLQPFRDHRSRKTSFLDSEVFSSELSDRNGKPAIAAHWGLSITAPVQVREPAALTENITEAEETKEQEENGSAFKVGIVTNGLEGRFLKSHSADDADRPELISAQSAGSLGINSDQGSVTPRSKRPSMSSRGSGGSIKSFRFGSGAVKSDAASESAGIRITHNPRSQRNLQLGMGQELSRAQVAVIELISDDKISEEEEIAEEEKDKHKLESAIARKP